MKKKLLEQTCLCIIIALALLISNNSNIKILERGAGAVMTYMEKSYTAEDIKKAVNKGAELASAVPSKITGTIAVITGSPVLGEPVDMDSDEQMIPVRAVAGGEVDAVGESETIGKYIRITHGSTGESLYGNMKEVKTEVPARVKKGQIIGIYDKNSDEEFYYSFKEFN
ncbi:MAG: M23 family metallopeptidase [Bacillota bacterium]|nr:M23 family metallopeptidase [Bacillota bacterium]